MVVLQYGYGIVSIALVVLATASVSEAQSNERNVDESDVGFWNVATPTMGGRQFWTDTKHFGGWRIQRNHLTGHHRLLDRGNIRRAWGNLAHCERQLEQAAIGHGLEPYRGKVVILLHGLLRSSASLKPMERYLVDNGYQVINFEYASGRGNINDHAVALENIVGQLGEDVTEIDFFAHSLGNLVVRKYLHNTLDEVTGETGDSRIRRMVMCGPPNNGSRLARMGRYTFFFDIVTGEAGEELSTHWARVEPLLATPGFEFGIIAGGQSEDAVITNFLLTGRDDFTVSVDETRLPGAHDFVVRPLLHGTMMQQPESMEMTLRFLQRGHFVSEAQRCPLDQNGEEFDD